MEKDTIWKKTHYGKRHNMYGKWHNIEKTQWGKGEEES
jgi:hypothetical protein